MALIKTVGGKYNLDSNLNGVDFTNTTSETVFSFGDFTLTSNFAARVPIDYRNTISSFAKPVTLDNLSLNQSQAQQIYDFNNTVVLNLNKTDLNTYVRYGSTYELFRVSIQNIILAFPASLFANSQTDLGGNITYFDYVFNPYTNISSFKIPSQYIQNKFGIVFNRGNVSIPDNNKLKNINISYSDFIIWTSRNSTDFQHSIVGFTGDTSSVPYVKVNVIGNVFDFMSGATQANINFHLRPNNQQYQSFQLSLSDFEQHFISNKPDTKGFEVNIKNPTLFDDGSIQYIDTTLLWTTSDEYNVDFNGVPYNSFLNSLLGIGGKYDSVKTDLIARFLTPASIKKYDLTQEGKITKLLRIYGREFDELRKFIDSIAFVNTITYNKVNNLPDRIVKNLAKAWGWDVFSLVNEQQLVESILTTQEENTNRLLPFQIDIELWRRILINTNFYWKSKGTRDAIKSIFLLIGIPEPFINITEYVYTIDAKIDPRTVTLSLADMPSASLPYDKNGYPVAPIQSPNFYFQTSGDTDSGQAYMNIFRNVGFNLKRQVDNKKSWNQDGSVDRVHYSTPTYHQMDSRLVLNTKEVDVTLDTARGIEFDVYNYVKNIDFPANSSGYTLPYSFVNILCGYTGSTTTFTIPNTPEGDVDVYYNGMLLTINKFYNNGVAGTSAQNNYSIVFNNTIHKYQVVLNNLTASKTNADIIQIDYLYKIGSVVVNGSVKYVVTRVYANLAGTIIPLPDSPNGDVQLTLNGLALTKTTSDIYNGDYVIDPNNSQQIIIQNPAITAFLSTNPVIQVSYIVATNNLPIYGRTEVLRVDSFNSAKFYRNTIQNRFIYKLNYKMNDISNVKILLNGITLVPNIDYTLNISNRFEIFLPPNINYGDVITAFYVVGGSDIYSPLVNDFYGLGDISSLSFLEFIELIQKKLINAKTRKIVTNHIGGFYPALLDIYIRYLNRSYLLSNDPLHSNGYTFENLYPFLNKYNSFFQKFVDELLSTTIIMRKSGLLVRNTVFTKQKFMYRRGVSFDPAIQYLGDNGSMFKKVMGNQTYSWDTGSTCQLISCNDFILKNIVFIYSDTGTTAPVIVTPSTIFSTNVLLRNDGVVTGTNHKVLSFSLVFNPILPVGAIAQITLDFSNASLLNTTTDNNLYTYPTFANDITILTNNNGIALTPYYKSLVSVGSLAPTTQKLVITVNSGDQVRGTADLHLAITNGGTYTNHSSNQITISIDSATINTGTIVKNPFTLPISFNI